MEEMAQKYGKTYPQIAIQWLLSQENVTAIVKSSEKAHLKENLGGTGWTMESEDVERLRREYPTKS